MAGGGDKVDGGDVGEGGAGGVELHVEGDPLLPEILHPQAGGEHVLPPLVQYQHLPHKGGGALQSRPGRGGGGRRGGVQVQQRQQRARLRLQQRTARHRIGGGGKTWDKKRDAVMTASVLSAFQPVLIT